MDEKLSLWNVTFDIPLSGERKKKEEKGRGSTRVSQDLAREEQKQRTPNCRLKQQRDDNLPYLVKEKSYRGEALSCIIPPFGENQPCGLFHQ